MRQSTKNYTIIQRDNNGHANNSSEFALTTTNNEPIPHSDLCRTFSYLTLMMANYCARPWIWTGAKIEMDKHLFNIQKLVQIR